MRKIVRRSKGSISAPPSAACAASEGDDMIPAPKAFNAPSSRIIPNSTVNHQSRKRRLMSGFGKLSAKSPNRSMKAQKSGSVSIGQWPKTSWKMSGSSM